MSRAKIVVIGAAGAGVGLETVSGLLGEGEALRDVALTLVDVDAAALETMATFARRANEERGAGLLIDATTDRLEALRGADYVVISVEVDRFATWEKDWEIPLKHGIKHMLGENGGPGGLSHALRTVPIVLEICRDVEAVAPDALVLNYTHPMTRVCLALTRHTSLKVVGLCRQPGHVYYNIGRVMGWVTADHGTPEEREQALEGAEWLDIPACGLNHLTFMTGLRDMRTGNNLYPAFRERLAAGDPGFEPISRRVHEVFGLYPCQGDSHIGEYFAWAPATKPEGPPFADWRKSRAGLADRLSAAARGEMSAGELLEQNERRDAFKLDRAPRIIAALVEGRTRYELAVNVVNHGCIEGLPDWAVVEVPAVVGNSGVKGVPMGSLPAGIASLLNEQIAIQDRAVAAAVAGDRRAASEALLLDPVTNRDAAAAQAMLDEMLRVHAPLLPRFA